MIRSAPLCGSRSVRMNTEGAARLSVGSLVYVCVFGVCVCWSPKDRWPVAAPDIYIYIFVGETEWIACRKMVVCVAFGIRMTFLLSFLGLFFNRKQFHVSFTLNAVPGVKVSRCHPLLSPAALAG